MDQETESNFMDNEAKFLKQYNEDIDGFTALMDAEKQMRIVDKKDESAMAELFDDVFTKQRHLILNYVYDLIMFAAKIHEIKTEDIFSPGRCQKRVSLI